MALFEQTLEWIDRLTTQAQLLQVIHRAAERARGLESDERKEAMTNGQLDVVLAALRDRGIWEAKNDESMNRIVAAGASRQAAFRTLTDGNGVVRAIMDEVLNAPVHEVVVTPEPMDAETVQPTPQGRTRRQRES